MSGPSKRIMSAIEALQARKYTQSQMHGALFGASNQHYAEGTSDMPKADFARLMKTIKESGKNPEADARAILTPENRMAHHQFETMAKTLYDKYKPGEGGAAPASGKSKPAASKTKPASSKAGSGSADDSKEVEELMASLSAARRFEAILRAQHEDSVAEVKKLEMELDRKRKRDQA
jgi:hypothetical protein